MSSQATDTLQLIVNLYQRELQWNLLVSTQAATSVSSRAGAANPSNEIEGRSLFEDAKNRPVAPISATRARSSWARVEIHAMKGDVVAEHPALGRSLLNMRAARHRVQR